MITSLYAGLLGLMFIALSINVIRSRRDLRTALGDNDDTTLKRRIRAHSNFAEYTPLFLILLALAEYHRLPSYTLHGIALLFVAGRLMHAYSMLHHEQYANGKITHRPHWRIRAMFCTFTALGLLSAAALFQYAAS